MCISSFATLMRSSKKNFFLSIFQVRSIVVITAVTVVNEICEVKYPLHKILAGMQKTFNIDGSLA